eukprot:scaffold50706_cov39-Attheya_sp.AAC.1
MGNRNSSAQSNEALSPETKAAVADNVSGIFLSEGLQKSMVSDFQSEVLKEEWKSRQKFVLAKSNQRIVADEQRKQELEKKLSVWKEQDTRVHERLDERLDELKTQFSETELEIRHDASRIQSKIGQGPKTGKGNECIDQRVNLSSCFKSGIKNNPLVCDPFLDALENCVQKAITSN